MTKVVLTGATGFVGGEILRRLLDRPEVTEISCLTRRPPGPTSAKLSVLLHDDFARYDDRLLDRLVGHDACIWAMGGKAIDIRRPGELERVTHTFTLAFARALAGRRSDRFTFCYLSGMGADPSETAWFPWERQTRHLKGRTERDLAELQRMHPNFCVHSFRPGGILPVSASGLVDYILAPIVVRVGVLADAMITAAIDPAWFGRAPLLSNAGIKRLAGEAAGADHPREGMIQTIKRSP